VLAAGALALSACGSSTASPKNIKVASNYSYGSIPTPSTTVKSGGTVTFAQTPGFGPNWILPITPAANSSVFAIDQFQALSWRPLYWSPQGSSPEMNYPLSLATAAPVVSNGGKTFTVTLNGQYKWANGTPVTATDVEFNVDLLKAAVKESAANDGNYTPGQFPDNVTNMTVSGANTIAFTFNAVYNPAWVQDSELDQIFPLPSTQWNISSTGGAALSDWATNPTDAKAIYDYLNKQSSTLSTYGTNPLWQDVDGPFKISFYNPSTNAVNLVANPAYTGADKPHIAAIDELAYTSTDAEFNDLLSGKLDVGYVDFSDLPQVAKLKSKGYNVYGLPDYGFQYLNYNFKDTTDDFNNVIGQLYVRQAFAHLQDESAEISGPLHGAGVASYGSVGVAPSSPFTPASALTNPFPFSVASASSLLTSNGWTVVPDGKTTCTKPGTGAGECGAGIASGQDIAFTLYYSTSPAVIGQIVTSWVANLKKVGITVTLKTDTANNIIQNQDDPSSPNNEALWGASDFGGFTNGLYPSTDNLFNTGGSYNEGDFSNKTLDTDINNSINSPNPSAIEAELAEVTALQPALFQPNPDNIIAWKNTLSSPADGISNMTQYTITPEEWYFN
jgi:peptide/nickel transport system substrate-binding protein